MSLVGSLEDLGLGDILQIISLSRKSGVLVLRADEGEGQIVFSEGAIATAYAKGGPTDLRELLGRAGSVGGADLEAAAQEAKTRGRSFQEVVVERGLAPAEDLDALRRDYIENTVLGMFTWPSGEFSFEISDRPAELAGDLGVVPGINPQFMALEGTRFRDENQRDEADAPLVQGELVEAEADSDATGGLDLDAAFAPHEPEPTSVEAAPVAEPESAADSPAPAAPPTPGPAAAPAGVDPLEGFQAEGAASEEAGAAPAPAARPKPSRAPVPPVIVIDADLGLLEWVKDALEGAAPLVHIFQRPDHGMNRIRQYLSRARSPLVLLAADVPADALSGARNAREIVKRLKSQASRMPILLLAEEGSEEASSPPKGVDGVAIRPTATELADPRCVEARAALAARLRESVAGHAELLRPEASPQALPADLSPETLERIKSVSERLRNREASGETLRIVMHFALESFRRVALFMVRDGVVHGLAQLGLPRAGGPDDAGVREVAVPATDSGWFRSVLEERRPVRGGPSDDGDQRLTILLGNAIPAEAYVAPIESGDQIVALLYGDNLPGGEPIRDTGALEVVLQQAGLVLDRACLERILEEAERS